MTTGFQHQDPYHYPVTKAAPRPQNKGARLEERDKPAPAEPRRFDNREE